MNSGAVPYGVWRFLRWFFLHLYTDLAWSYDAVAWLSSFGGWSSWRRTALDRVSPSSTVLEVGFGTGHLLAEASQYDVRLFGVDASPQMVRITARRLRRAGLPLAIARAEAQALPFPRHAFPAALSTFPSEYIFDEASLADIRRVLTPGASLVVVVSARILPRSLWEYVIRWLYDKTGQSPGPDPRYLEPFHRAGFAAHYETVEVPGASVLQIIARAP